MSNHDTIEPPPPEPSLAQEREPDGDGLLRRVERLEEARMDTRERLVRIETRLDGIVEQMATKTDIQTLRAEMGNLETRLLKWFVATAVALATLAFAAARYIR